MAITTDSITRIKEGDLARRTSDRADFKNPQQGSLARPSVYREEPIDTLGEAFSAGISSGYDNIRAQNQNFLAALDTLKGDDVSARNRIREADFLEDQAGIPLRGLESDFASSLEEGNVHDFMLNFASATGQFIPSLAASLAEAAVVGGVVAGGTVLSGGTATPALLGAAAAGTTARRKAVEGGVKALQRRKPGIDKADVEDLLNRSYKNQLRVKAGKQPLHKFSKEELRNLDDIYGVMRSNLRGKRFTQGAVLGAFTQEQRMGTGIAFSDYVDQGMDSKQDAINSILQGTAFGVVGVGSEALTAATTFRAFKRPGRVKKAGVVDPFKFDPIPPGSMFKDFASISAVTAASEGLAELLQEELSVQQKFRIDDTYTKAQARVDRVNALFAGLMGGLGVGGGLGAGTAVINKARNLSQRGAAEREMMRIFSDREFQASIGAVMGERAGALEAQFEFIKNENSGPRSVFVPIEAKGEFAKIQDKVESMFGDNELFSVSTPTGVFFTTDQRAAGRLANIMDSGYKYDTGILEGFLAKELGFSRGRDPKDDIVVGLFDNEKGEFVKYQSAREDVKGDAEAAQAAMNKIRAAMDPKRYTIEIQSLAQHRKFRQEGLPKDADVLKATKEAFETSDMSEMGTSDDDAGVEGDRGQINLDIDAANIDITRGLVTDIPKRPQPLNKDIAVDIERPQQPLPPKQNATPEEQQTYRANIRRYQEQLKTYNASQKEKTRFQKESEVYRRAVGQYQQSQGLQDQFDAYLRQEYKLPITYNELVFFLQQTRKLLRARAAVKTTGKKQLPSKTLDVIGKPGSNTRKDYSRIYGELINAEKNAGPLNAEDRAFLQRMNSGGLETLALELDGVLQEIAEGGAQLQQSDSISSSLARDEFGSREVTNVPLVGVSEVLSRTNVELERPNPKDFKKGRKDKTYIKQLAAFRAAQREAKAPIKEQDPVVMAKKGSGTVQNPFVDPKTDKGFEISKGDPKADGRSIAGLNTFIHPTLKTEFNEQKPYLSKRAVQTFKDKAKIEREETSETGFLRFVDVRDLRDLRTATANNQPFVAPERPVVTKTKPKAKPAKKNVPFKTFLRNNKLDPKAVGVAELRDRLDKGTFSYTKTGGMGVDQLIEAAVDAGYLTEDNAGPQGQKTYTVDDIVELIDSNATPLADQEASFEAQDEARRLEAEGEQEVEQEVEEPTQDTNRRYVIVRMKPDPEQFREITRENVDTLRNIRADLQIRLDQAHARTRSGTYKTPIHFKLQNLNPEAKSRTPINIDMSVLLEGIFYFI